MITFCDAILTRLSIHFTGNKLHDELYRLSAKPLSNVDDNLSKLLMLYFLTPFEKVNEIYRLSHPSGNLDLNELFHFASNIFASSANFHNNSIQITKHLYEVSATPK